MFKRLYQTKLKWGFSKAFWFQYKMDRFRESYPMVEVSK